MFNFFRFFRRICNNCCVLWSFGVHVVVQPSMCIFIDRLCQLFELFSCFRANIMSANIATTVIKVSIALATLDFA